MIEHPTSPSDRARQMHARKNLTIHQLAAAMENLQAQMDDLASKLRALELSIPRRGPRDHDPDDLWSPLSPGGSCG